MMCTYRSFDTYLSERLGQINNLGVQVFRVELVVGILGLFGAALMLVAAFLPTAHFKELLHTQKARYGALSVGSLLVLLAQSIVPSSKRITKFGKAISQFIDELSSGAPRWDSYVSLFAAGLPYLGVLMTILGLWWTVCKQPSKAYCALPKGLYVNTGSVHDDTKTLTFFERVNGVDIEYKLQRVTPVDDITTKGSVAESMSK